MNVTNAVPVRVASDIGGTFTDLVHLTPDGVLTTLKVPSTPADYGAGVIDGIQRLTAACGLSVHALSDVLHGCTVATNAILEHKGAKCALITTKGFRDVLEMRRIRMPELYNPLFVKPLPLVPRHLRFEVEERCTYAGEILKPVNRVDLEAVVASLRAARVEAVAVAFLHAYANPENERLVGEVLRERLPGVFVTRSSELVPEIREYERTSTTVINAYVGPPVERYLSSLMDQLTEAGFEGRFLVMQSSGGILGARRVMKKPCEIIECGPAAGVIACARVGSLAGYPNIISLDMGGTTAKASIVENGRLSLADEYEVGGGISLSSRLVQGGGYSLKTPAIDIAEVGAGGGSVVWIDKAGSLKVGPQSVGSNPGPACFEKGGQQATITDANLLLGYIGARSLAGGSISLSVPAARSVIEEQVARPLNRDLLEAAYGVHVIANANMLRAIKAVSVYRGRNPKHFVLFAFGGNGPIHAAELARALGIRQVVVPHAAGVFSAVGLLFADVTYTHSGAFFAKTSAIAVPDLDRAYRRIEGEVVLHMDYPREQLALQRQADLRYQSQAFEITIPLRPGTLESASIRQLEEDFEREHEQTYGYRFPAGHPIQVVALRIVGSVVSSSRPTRIAMRDDATPPSERHGSVYFGSKAGQLDTPVLGRAALRGSARRGPLLIEEYDTTIVVPPYARVQLDAFGNVVIDIEGQPGCSSEQEVGQ